MNQRELIFSDIPKTDTQQTYSFGLCLWKKLAGRWPPAEGAVVGRSLDLCVEDAKFPMNCIMIMCAIDRPTSISGCYRGNSGDLVIKIEVFGGIFIVKFEFARGPGNTNANGWIFGARENLNLT